MQHHKSQIYQRKNRKGEKGVWYYRKRIPADVLGTWKANGRTIKEYNASLFTTDKREAERRAVKEHSKFLNILEIKRQENRVALSKSQERIAAHYKYEATLRRLGAHPEQAPPVNAPLEVIQQYQEAVDQAAFRQAARLYKSPFGALFWSNYNVACVTRSERKRMRERCSLDAAVLIRAFWRSDTY